MSKLSRIKAKKSAVDLKRAELAAAELDFNARIAEKFADFAQKKKAIDALELELQAELATITDLDAADPAPTKPAKV